MDRSVALTATVIVSTLWAIFAFPHAAATSTPRHRRFAQVFWHPLAQFLLVCLLLLANQILCHAYVWKVHGGDAKFVLRYLGPGWFDVSSSRVVLFVADHIGDGKWLAPTVLRVQAVLELPFTLFAYLAVARMLGRDVHRRLLRAPVLFAASASFTIAFALAELGLPNPWTTDDLVLRVISAVVAPGWVVLAARLEGGGAEESRPLGAVGLVGFVAGAAAIAAIVLAAYDSFLLYNLGHLAQWAGVLVVAIAVAALAAWLVPRARAGSRSPSPAALATVNAALVTFTLVFFVPSLAIRYAASSVVAQIAGLVLVGGSLAVAIGKAERRIHVGVAFACAAVAATVVGVTAVAAVGATRIPEISLAVFAATALVAAIATLHVLDRIRA